MQCLYVTEPDNALLCVICLDVAEDPWQHGKCGKLLCRICMIRYGQEKACPNCKRGPPQYFEDTRSKKDIQALLVQCPNDGCVDTMERQQLKEHVKAKCPHTVILCKYRSIGCAAKMKRGHMAAHEQAYKLHLHMAVETVTELKEQNQKEQVYKFVHYQKGKDKKKLYHFYNSALYTHPNGYRMTLGVYANGCNDGEGTHVSVGVRILQGKYDTKLKWPFVGKCTITLLNQLEDKNHYTKELLIKAENNVCVTNPEWGISKFFPHSALAHDPVKNTQYLKDDTLYFRLEVEVDGYKQWLQ